MPTERDEISIGIDEGSASAIGSPPDDPLSQLDKAKNLFFVFIAIGMLVISIPTMFNLSNLYGFPASAVVCIYAFMAYKRQSDFMDKEVVADAIYYLGFLYTFIALLIGFLSSVGDVVALNIIELIGVALMTTVFGLSIRIYLIHFQRLDLREEQELRQSVAQSMALLNSEINSSINHIRNLRENSINDLTASIDSIQNSVTSSLEGFEEGLSTQLEQARQSVREEMNANLNTHIENLNEIAQQSIQNLADVTEGLVARINDIDIPQDIVTTHFNEALEDFHSQGQALGTAVGEVNRLVNEERQSINLINNQLETLSTHFNQIELDFEPLRQVSNIANNLNQSLTQLNTRLNSLDHTFVNNIDNFAENIQQASDAFIEARTSVERISASIQETIDGLNTYIENRMRD